MKRDDMSMSDDLTESAYVRRLLRTGRNAQANYDIEKGLARHLANLKNGAPLPLWAAGLPVAPTAASWTTWLAAPLLGVVLFGGWYLTKGSETSQLLASQTQIAAIAPAVAKDNAVQLQAALAMRAAAVASASAAERALQPTAAEAVATESTTDAGRSVHARSTARPSASSKSLARAGSKRRAASAADAGKRGTGTGSSLHAPIAASPTDTGASNASSHTDSSSDRAASENDAVAQQLQQPKSAEPAPAEPAAAQPPAAPRPTAAVEKVAAVDDSKLEREMQMLAVTQRVLAEDPDRALRLARQGEREFANSMFSAERRQLALLALVQLGRLEEARKLGKPFLLSYPNAPWSARLRQALASGRLP
jgi:hypothetical protein